MTIKSAIRDQLRRAGIEMHRYNRVESSEARTLYQIGLHAIDLVLDVGANDGGYGRMLREGGYRGDILSFEPLSSAHGALCKRVASDGRWHVAPRMALGQEDSTVVINVAGNSTSSSILPMRDVHVNAAPGSRYLGTEQVPLQRLDGLSHACLDWGRSVFLKIDTQGYEMAVLRGAGRLIERIKGVQVELSLIPLYEGQPTYREVIGFLEHSGFSIWNLCPGFTEPRSGRMLQFDGVFFRE